MSGADVETLRRGYDALNQGDLSVVRELIDPDIEWHGKAVRWEAVPDPEEALPDGR